MSLTFSLVACSDDSTPSPGSSSSSGGTNDASTGEEEADAGDQGDSGVSESIEATIQGKKILFKKDKAYLYKATSKLVVRGIGEKREFIMLEFNGTPGTFSCAQGTSIEYTDIDGNTYYASGSSEGADCTVTLTKSGNVGELVEGTFVASLKGDGSGGNPSLLSATGSFRMIRAADIAE